MPLYCCVCMLFSTYMWINAFSLTNLIKIATTRVEKSVSGGIKLGTQHDIYAKNIQNAEYMYKFKYNMLH